MHMRGAAQPIESSEKARDLDLAARLWNLSEQLTAVAFPLKIGATPDTAGRAVE
jgi:hypothetical protein